MSRVKLLVAGALVGALLAYGYGIDPAVAQERVPSWIDLTDEAYKIEELEGRGYQVNRESGVVYAPPDACFYLPLEGVSEETVVETRQSLVAQGWYSDPTDNLEALYSPSCLPQEDN